MRKATSLLSSDSWIGLSTTTVDGYIYKHPKFAEKKAIIIDKQMEYSNVVYELKFVPGTRRKSNDSDAKPTLMAIIKLSWTRAGKPNLQNILGRSSPKLCACVLSKDWKNRLRKLFAWSHFSCSSKISCWPSLLRLDLISQGNVVPFLTLPPMIRTWIQ